MNIKPIYDRVVIELDNDESVSRGGIVLPSDENKKTQTGTIVNIGIGTLVKDSNTVVPPIVKIGQKATFSSYAAVNIDQQISDKKYVCIRESDILFVQD